MLALYAAAEPPAATAAPVSAQPPLSPAVLARLAGNQQAVMRRLEQYCFRQEFLYERLSSGGEVTRREQRVDAVCHHDGVPLYKHLVINGKPTGQQESDPWPNIKNDENWRKQVRRARERRDRFAEIITDVPRAFIFTEMGREDVDGLPTVVYKLTPNPAYEPKSVPTEMLRHVAGRAWLHLESAHMVRLAAVVEEDFNLWGGLLLKVRKGATFEMRQRQVNGVWLPVYTDERWHARIGLFKQQAQHQRVQRNDFRPVSQMVVAEGKR